MTRYEVWLPAYFWADHQDRCLESGEYVKGSQRRVLVRVTQAEIEEIESDALYYADGFGFDPEIQRTVCQWARSMLKAIDRHREAGRLPERATNDGERRLAYR